MTRGANHGGRGARQTLRAGAVVAVVLAPSLAACAAGFDESFTTPAPVSEATTSKGLTLSVGPAPLRFAVPVRVEPPSFAARVDVFVQTASRSLRVEVLPESFASDDPAAWALVGPGAVLETFLSGQQDETLRLEELFGPRRGQTAPMFALQVDGWSMRDEGIFDGDYVIVERRQTARNGERVVALLPDGETTLKTFFKERDGRIRLQPANPEFEPIIVDRCEVQGVVVGVMRRY
jgi:repressor LexA